MMLNFIFHKLIGKMNLASFLFISVTIIFINYIRNFYNHIQYFSAAKSRFSKIVDLLLKKNADVNTRTLEDYTALIIGKIFIINL